MITPDVKKAMDDWEATRSTEGVQGVKHFLFAVKEKATNRIYPIYDVRNDKNGYPQFLTYIFGRWQYVSAKFFEPKED